MMIGRSGVAGVPILKAKPMRRSEGGLTNVRRFIGPFTSQPTIA